MACANGARVTHALTAAGWFIRHNARAWAAKPAADSRVLVGRNAGFSLNCLFNCSFLTSVQLFTSYFVFNRSHLVARHSVHSYFMADYSDFATESINCSLNTAGYCGSRCSLLYC